MLDVFHREAALLKFSSHASIESCEVQWKSLNREDEEQEVPGDDDFSGTDSLELLLKRGAGWTQETSAVDYLLFNAWNSLKVKLTRPQIRIPTIIEKVLDLGLEALVSRNDIQQ